jgi:hypothetical protein
LLVKVDHRQAAPLGRRGDYMFVVPAIAGLTVDGRFVEPKAAAFATAVDHRDNAKICM